MVVAATLQATATVSPADYDTTYYSVVFASDDANVATVNSATGLILGVGAGTCNIAAEFVYGPNNTSFDPAISDSVEITVTTE